MPRYATAILVAVLSFVSAFYVHGLAARVSSHIEDVRKQMRSASREEQALLVALHLADELAEERARAASAREELRRHTEAMVGKLTQALDDDLDTHEIENPEIADHLSDRSDVDLATASARREA